MHKKIVMHLCQVLLILGLLVYRSQAYALLSDEKNTIQIFTRISPLVVNVHNLQSVNSPQGLYDVQAGIGSGLIWDLQGHIITSYHVIAHANKIAITVNQGKTVIAKYIGGEPRKDVAILQIQDQALIHQLSTQLHPLAMANSANLSVGQKVIAVGNPFGLDRTLTTGVISALGREVPGYGGISIHDMIQTDASINPGNSGGPLVDSAGQLIGINTMIYSTSGNSAGVGFATPINDINRIVQQILQFGKVVQPGLGVQRFSDSIAKELGVEGVVIEKVIPGSPAAMGGLRGTTRATDGSLVLGDIIIGIDKAQVKDYDDLYTALEKKQVGDVINVKILRHHKIYGVKMKTIDVSS